MSDFAKSPRMERTESSGGSDHGTRGERREPERGAGACARGPPRLRAPRLIDSARAGARRRAPDGFCPFRQTPIVILFGNNWLSLLSFLFLPILSFLSVEAFQYRDPLPKHHKEIPGVCRTTDKKDKNTLLNTILLILSKISRWIFAKTARTKTARNAENQDPTNLVCLRCAPPPAWRRGWVLATFSHRC
jgi:hypothetical protein